MTTAFADKSYADVAGGDFWVFHSQGVSIADPEHCSVYVPYLSGEELRTVWNDGIYMVNETDNVILMSAERNATRGEVIVISCRQRDTLEHQTCQENSCRRKPGSFLWYCYSWQGTSLHRHNVVLLCIASSSCTLTNDNLCLRSRLQYWTYSLTDSRYYIIDVRNVSSAPVQFEIANGTITQDSFFSATTMSTCKTPATSRLPSTRTFL